MNASDVIILEGILVFHDQRVRNLMNMKIFVDTGMKSHKKEKRKVPRCLYVQIMPASNCAVCSCFIESTVVGCTL